tara:strand:- start:2744 stop:3580 length:837 start_codon:yes stop_codon:yes gene_type:complete
MFTLIENLKDFEFLDHEIVKNKSCIGIDTEFKRTNKNNMKLGLLQIFDGEEIFLIDPISIGPLSKKCNFLISNKVTKVFHSFREDIESIYSWTGDFMNNIYDTQLAEAILGRDYALSYQDLVYARIGIKLDKNETRSNWIRRPLSDSQLKYASLDVEYLIHIFEEQREELKLSKKFGWVLDESKFYTDNLLNEKKDEKAARENLTKEDELVILQNLNKIVIELSKKLKVNQTLLLSKKIQKDLIRKIFSSGLEEGFLILAPWKRKLLFRHVVELIDNY